MSEVLLDAIASTPDEMERIGERIASWVGPGDVVLLDGPLGAGKTTLTRGLGRALGVRGAVTSPTFVIARVHPGEVPLVHVDAYRIGSWAEFDDLDLDHDLASAVTVIEWGSGVAEGMAPVRLEVEIARASGAEGEVVDGDPARTDDVDPRRVVVTAIGGFSPRAPSATTSSSPWPP